VAPAKSARVGIIVLEESVASKIAAGEVIERPASVVKELIENALDAGARRVEVEAREGGRGLIRVADDGCGMSREDAVLSLQRYATSKIRAAEDLFAITTLGFRGEALPSIAAVSHLTLVTRSPDAAEGVRLVAVAGEVTELEPTGAAPGTELSVRNLFYNTPARLKFLRRDEAELGHITDVFTRFLFSHPEVALRLSRDEQPVIQHAGARDLRSAVQVAWGRELAEAMVPVELSLPGMSVRGLVSAPSFHRGSRGRQYLFINRRWVRSRALAHALEEAYRRLLPEGRRPAAVLLVEVDRGSVDVNVHPTKSEVRLSREWEVHHLVSRAVQEAVGSAGPAARLDLAQMTSAARPAGPLPGGEQRELPAGWAGTLAAPGVLSPAFQAAGGPVSQLRPLAQLRQTYILAESAQGLLLVDQHRAQERILYERFTQARLSRQSSSQVLLEPASVQLGPREATSLAEQLDDLSAFGFEIEAFGSDSFLVRSVPAALARDDPAAVVRDLAEDLAAEAGVSSLERRRERLLVTLSCHSAVKAGDALSYEETVELLDALTATARPYTCPHGWPIVMTISNFEIDRKFNR
jgi:DNA mismatch repair protein MutL